MIRNFVAGIVWGGVAGVLGLAVVSQLAPAPMPSAANQNAPIVGQTPPTTADGDQAAVAETTKAASTATEATPPVSPTTPAVMPETAPDLADDKTAETAAQQDEPAAATQTETATAAESAPVAESVVGATQADNAATKPLEVLPEPAPAEAGDPTVAVPPPPAAEPPTGLKADAPQSPADLAVKAVPSTVVAASDAAPGGAVRPGELPVTSGGDAAPSAAQLPPPAPVVAPEAMLAPAPDLQKDAAPAQIALEPVPEPAPAALPQAQPLPAVEPPLPASTLAPSAPLKPAVTGVAENTLPQIGDTPAPVEATEPTPVTDDRPIAAFARSFSNPNSKPEFVVVLRDTGAADLDRATLAALPFPVSFVIDPSQPDAAAHAAIYRAGGQEVVMLATGIPQGATAADLEQTFQANAALLPESVAVMDMAVAGFQDDRMLAAQVVSVIGAQGRGVLTFDRGLNAANQVARREQVPAAVVFRELDAEGEDAQKIRRYLDRAAFKAAQEGSVVVAGSTRPETIAALMEWTVEGRASSVEMAPLTAVLTQP